MKLAILGRSEGNGHPYSWSAIINGYNQDKMRDLCPFPIINDYLSHRDKSEFGINDARITHIWTEDKAESQRIAQCSNIPYVVDSMTDVLGEVDAVIIAQDEGGTHFSMAQPFLEQGMPVFIDKPFCLSTEDLRAFREYQNRGALIMSCSSARYAREYLQLAKHFPEKTNIQAVHSLAVKSWEKYGIHALEAVTPIVGSDFSTVQYLGSTGHPAVYIEMSNGIPVWLQLFSQTVPGMTVRVIGSADSRIAFWQDYFTSFKTTLSEFISSVDEGKARIDFEETVRITKVIIGGMMSREQGGAKINLEDLRL